MALALDTLAYARRLREAGLSEQQADAHAEALAAAMTDSLATKQDLRELEVRIDARFLATKQDLRDLEVRIDARFTQVDTRFAELEKRIDVRFTQVDAHFAELEKRLEIRFSEQSARFHVEVADLERRMTLRMGGIMVAGIGAVSALIKLL
jgi:hypothetical protein